MKKSSKTFLAFALAPLFAVALAFAAEGKVENKVAGCCVKAQSEGKTCAHACCVEAAKLGNNCTKCKGSGKIEKTADVKK
jgi:hypothetical protein